MHLQYVRLFQNSLIWGCLIIIAFCNLSKPCKPEKHILKYLKTNLLHYLINF